MRERTTAIPLVLLAGAAVFLALSCSRRSSGEATAASTSFAPEALLAVEASTLPATVRARYRLRPDRRLLAAVGEVGRLLAGTKSAPAEAQFRDDRWRVALGGDELGELAAFPDFAESTDLLVRYARKMAATASRAAVGSPPAAATEKLTELRRSLEVPDPARILAALSALEIERPVAATDGEEIRAMVAGLAWVTTLTTDKLEQSDALFSQAWAWLAVERAFEIRGNEGSEALLARALGYEAAAVRAAGALPADDAIRLFVSGERAQLNELCARSPANVAMHLLLLALDAERGDRQRYRRALRDFPASGMGVLGLLGFEVQVRDYERTVGAGRALAETALRAVRSCGSPERRIAASDPAEIAATTRDFEAAVAKCGGRLSTGPLGAAAVEAYFRSAYYSGLFEEAQFVSDRLASGPAALRLAAEFGEPAPGAAADLRRWLLVNGAVIGGDPAVRPLAELIESSPALGSQLLLDLGQTIAAHSESTEPLRRRPIPALFAQLDARPAHRLVAARVARANLTSAWLFETFSRAAAEAAPHRSEELPALVAEMRAEAGPLRAIVDDPAMPTYAQTAALAALAELGEVDDAFVRARYEAIARDPDGGIAPLVDFLEKRGDFAGALSAVAAARDREPEPGSLAWTYYQSEAALWKLRLGDPEGAWKLVVTALPPNPRTAKEDVLLAGAEVQLARRRFASALELAQACLDRYPQSFYAAALLARARWALDDPATAARELAASRTGIVGVWSRILPEAFVAAFAGQPAERTQRAFAEMIAAQVPTVVLARTAIYLGKKEGLDVALPMLEGLPKLAPEWAVQIGLDTHDLIAEKSGEAAATAWYGAKHRPTIQEALILYQSRKYELLLGLFPSAEKPTGPGVVRLLKIAALLHLKEGSGPRWQALENEVAQDKAGSDFFARAARYLVGKLDAGSLWDAKPDLENVASVGWTIGVKAASERRFVDAEGWFQVALESGQPQQPPHAWAWQLESDWLMAQRTLELLEKEGKF